MCCRRMMRPDLLPYASMDQLNLLGPDTERPPFQPERLPGGHRAAGYNLFVAVVPGPEAAGLIGARADGLRRQHGLDGPLIGAERLHISLHALGGFTDTVPGDVVDAAMAACAGIACSPMPVVFDHAASFPDAGLSGKNPFVLQCDAGSAAALRTLRQPLGRALRSVGLHPQPSSTPHMTLLYDRAMVSRRSIDPICWSATRFALILSHVGLGHHQWIGQWRLGERS
jgi:2'-5' RNA ligase